MIHRTELLKSLQRELPKIEKDILSYSESREDLTEHLNQEYQKAKNAGRTAEHFVAWREAQITQAAVAWLLTCVFVRFLEDNQLIKEPMLSGPVQTDEGNKSLQHAKERMVVYFNENPTHAEREYLLNLFEQLEQFPVIAELLDHRHNPLWQIPVSGDGAKQLIDFFQKIDPESGDILHDFTDPDWDTRFIGDLYQDLSESIRKRYALLQTPEFVESFILDYTLEKSKDTFGLKGLRLIDPTCGSGHFLLSTFNRIFEDWVKREPSENTRVLAQRALDVVHGVDINPYAIAVCRFRLLIAAMKAAGSNKIKNAPDFHFNLACGDSLLHGRRFEWQGQGQQTDLIDEDPIKHVLEVEDKEKLHKILGQQYHVVVGNPPYITVKDKALNQAYRHKYPTCRGKYSLGVPFTERFFDLTLPAIANHPPGFMGMITTNSFMKRKFGKYLIEDYLPKKDLTHVIDTSGAYIPGHGTPTVILFARNQQPRMDKVRSVLGIRGEPSTPKDASQGKVWCSILELLNKPGNENEYVSVLNQEREIYSKHPWSVGGGGASELRSHLDETCSTKLIDVVDSIGIAVVPLENKAFVVTDRVLRRFDIEDAQRKVFVDGDAVRDWHIEEKEASAVFPYRNPDLQPTESPKTIRFLWPLKVILKNRIWFRKTQEERGLKWYEYAHISRSKFNSPITIALAEIASHNHFVLDRKGTIFNNTVPIIKVSNSTFNPLALLGFLNSSVVCFWMKQVSHQKQMTGGDGVRVTDRSKVPYQFPGSVIKNIPIPEAFKDVEMCNRVEMLSTQADLLVSEISELSANNILVNALMDGVSPNELWISSLEKRACLRGKLILIQEELDWTAYHVFGLCESELLADINNWTDVILKVGQRPFEIMAGVNSDDFEVPTEPPIEWPDDMRNKWQQRTDAINNIKEIHVIEDSHYKRRWIGRQGLFNHTARSDELKNACQEWLLDYLEHHIQVVELQTCAQLVDRTRNDGSFNKIASLYTGTDMFDAQSLISDLVAGDNVPQMAAARYKSKAMAKFRAWQETWVKQRSEDVIDLCTELDENEPGYVTNEQAISLKVKEIGDIPLPPKYISSDFRKPSYWALRGKLDVPKERFFSMPDCEKAGDTTLVIGWAGMNHLQRAQAIAAWYIERKETEGWEAEKLKPMLVALDELIPWLKQWHNEIDPEYGERMGDFYEGFLLEELRLLDIARDDLLSWEPPAASKKKRATKKKKSAVAE